MELTVHGIGDLIVFLPRLKLEAKVKLGIRYGNFALIIISGRFTGEVLEVSNEAREYVEKLALEKIISRAREDEKKWNNSEDEFDYVQRGGFNSSRI